MAKKAKSRAKKTNAKKSARNLPKNKATAASLPEGHLALMIDAEDTLDELSSAVKISYAKIRNLIRHLMHAHNALVDSSYTLEVKQAAAMMEIAIDAKIRSMNAFLSKELDKVRAKAPKRLKATPKRRKATKSKASPKKRRKARPAQYEIKGRAKKAARKIIRKKTARKNARK